MENLVPKYKLDNTLSNSVATSDKTCEFNSIISLFMAEYYLPFSVSQLLIKLAQKLFADPKVLILYLF